MVAELAAELVAASLDLDTLACGKPREPRDVRRSDDAARARVEVRDQDIRRPLEHGIRHSLEDNDGPGSASPAG